RPDSTRNRCLGRGDQSRRRTPGLTFFLRRAAPACKIQGGRVRRRGATRCIAILLLMLVAPGAAQTTAADKVYRLGELASTDASLEIPRAHMLPELAKLGFRAGHNVILDERVGDTAAMDGLAHEMLLRRPDAIIAIGAAAIDAAAKATKTVPIITFGANP